MTKKRGNDEEKTTNEKPVSLHPVDFDDALRALLITPPPKEPENKKPKPAKHKKD
jgi:hypothetical protein